MKLASRRVASRCLGIICASVVFLGATYASPAGSTENPVASPPDSSAPAVRLGPFKGPEDFQKFVKGLVSKYYPEAFTRLDVPKGYTLAFVLTARDNAARHVAFIDSSPDGTPITETLRGLFPEEDVDGSTENGAMCFPSEKGQHGHFCVIYVLAKHTAAFSG